MSWSNDDQTIIWDFVTMTWTSSIKDTQNYQDRKNGRTNENDGGIDFVVRPLGRFFQITETLDFNCVCKLLSC